MSQDVFFFFFNDPLLQRGEKSYKEWKELTGRPLWKMIQSNNSQSSLFCFQLWAASIKDKTTIGQEGLDSKILKSVFKSKKGVNGEELVWSVYSLTAASWPVSLMKRWL